MSNVSLTVYNPRKTYNGFTLFTPMPGEPSIAWLIDMQGRFVHRWQLPGWVRMHAELLPNGNLLFGLYDPEGPLGNLAFTTGRLIEMDWDSNIVWEYREPYMDGHDRARMKNGNTLIMKDVPIPKDIAAKVKGGVPGTSLGGEMWGICLQEITFEGKVVWECLTYEHLDFELDAITPGGWRWAWPGWNSIVELPDGNIMACSFNTSNIVIIDKATGDVKWRWGQGIISFPHDPSMLDNGNILLFDNGRFHVNWWPPDYSRVIEVNPNTNEIEWEYKTDNPYDFYSPVISGAQRLPNRNTLICEGVKGRLFEVTPSGEIVWEYVSPFFAYGGPEFGIGNAVFRCQRYGPDYPGLQGKKLDPEKLDKWNLLYGPEAFGPWGGGRLVGKSVQAVAPEEEASAQETAEMEVHAPQAKYEESKPGVAKPDKGEGPKPSAVKPGEEKGRRKAALESRLERLGY